MPKKIIINKSTEEIKKSFFSAIELKDEKKIIFFFQNVPIIDLSEFINDFEEKEKIFFIFKIIKNNTKSDFFSKLDKKTQEELIKKFDDNDIFEIFSNLYIDDIINILKNLPLNLHKKILKNCLKEQKKNIIEILKYKENTAASIMTKEYIELPENIKIDQALKEIQNNGKRAATIYTIFLKDNNNITTGICELSKLILSKKNEELKNIKNNFFLYVSPNDDQEKVAKEMQKYNLNVIAVLENQKIVGIITIDDIVDIIEEETSEDFELQAGVIPLKDNFRNISSFRMAINYSPWLIGLIITNIFSSSLLSFYEDKLKNFIFLTAFIPVILDTCGNAGGQTCSVIIRSLAIDETLTKKNIFFFAFLKELKTAFLTAFFVSLSSFVIFSIEIFAKLINSNNVDIWKISLIASSSLFVSLFLSKILGFIMPVIAKKINKDPALMSEPIVTTIADFLGILCYFKIASLLLSF